MVYRPGRVEVRVTGRRIIAAVLDSVVLGLLYQLSSAVFGGIRVIDAKTGRTPGMRATASSPTPSP